jgi:hypothetical protein
MGRLVFFGAVCAVVLTSQDKPTFRSTSRTVHVYATVQGRDGRLVPDLTRDEFRVFEDGREKPLTVFDNTPQAITVAHMFDMSNSMARYLERIRRLATGDWRVPMAIVDWQSSIGTRNRQSTMLQSALANLQSPIEICSLQSAVCND